MLTIALLHRVSWAFTSFRGTTVALTDGFYPDKGVKETLFGTNSTHSLVYEPSANGYAFHIKIKGALL